MRRGFKALAERKAAAAREKLGISLEAPLDSAALADVHGIAVRSADSLVSIERLEQLEAIQPGCFSACTFDLPRGKVIVVNPLSTPQRTQSDIAHEVSHALLEHQVRTVERVGDFSFFSCDSEEEQEANWHPRSVVAVLVEHPCSRPRVHRVWVRRVRRRDADLVSYPTLRTGAR